MNAEKIDNDILDVQVEPRDFRLLLEDRRKEKKFTDVQLQVGDQLFDAHRVVLSLYSPVLDAAISDHWSTTKVCPISDQYVDLSIVEPLLHFLYTGSIQLTPDNVHPVCVAAHYLQIPTLLKPAVEHLCQLVTAENVLQLLEFSVTCELKLLRHSCLRVISREHEKVFNNPEILKFSSRIFNDLIVGLKEQNPPGTMLKKNTFDCIVRWADVNLSERLDELPVLLKNIPLEELPLDFLTETVSEHHLVKEYIDCTQAVSAALAIIEPKEDNLVVFGRNGKSISCYDTGTKVWRELPNMLERRMSDFASTVLHRKDIVVCGGYGMDMRDLDSVEMFDWSSQTWKQLPRMPFSSTCCSMASLEDNLYVIGEEPEVGGSHEVVCYSFETEQWRYVKPMNYGRNFPELVSCNNYLYVFTSREVVERYDPVSDEWTNIDDIPELLRHGIVRDVTVHGNKIYVSIHADQKHFIEEFDPETNAWNLVSETAPEGFLGSMNGRLVISKLQTNWIYELNSVSESVTKNSFWGAYLSFFQPFLAFFKLVPQPIHDPAEWTKFLELNSDACRFVTGAFY